MARSTLAYAQISTQLFADPKVQRLSRRLDELRFHAALGIWLSIVVEAWAKGERTPIAGDRTDETELILALSDVGLLDEDGRIPESSWEKWWSPIATSREAAAERSRRYRERREGESSRHAPSRPVTVTERDGRHVTSRWYGSLPSGNESRSTGFSGDARAELAPAPDPLDEDDPLDVYYTLTARYPSSQSVRSWLEKLRDEHPMDDLRRAMVAEWTEDPDLGTFLSRTQTRLNRAADKERKAKRANGAATR